MVRHMARFEQVHAQLTTEANGSLTHKVTLYTNCCQENLVCFFQTLYGATFFYNMINMGTYVIDTAIPSPWTDNDDNRELFHLINVALATEKEMSKWIKIQEKSVNPLNQKLDI